jgi:hypothetical protein
MHDEYKNGFGRKSIFWNFAHVMEKSAPFGQRSYKINGFVSDDSGTICNEEKNEMKNSV